MTKSNYEHPENIEEIIDSLKNSEPKELTIEEMKRLDEIAPSGKQKRREKRKKARNKKKKAFIADKKLLDVIESTDFEGKEQKAVLVIERKSNQENKK
jgi:hypothetical protein